MHPWLKYVRDILNSCGLSYVWINQSFSSINWLKPIVKETLINQFLQDWFRNVENSPKCLNYRIFKKSFGQEIYLKKLPNDLRVLFTKFRTCNHKLPTETGRWSNIERFIEFVYYVIKTLWVTNITMTMLWHFLYFATN